MSTEVFQIKSAEDLKEPFQQLAEVLHNLRFYTKYWNEHGGANARKRMHYWQEMADKLLDSLGLTLHNNISSVKVIQY